MSEFYFLLISWEQIDGFWWNVVYAVLWLTREIFPNFSTELWTLIDVNISIFSISLEKTMHWYIWSVLWLIRIIFPNFSAELWPLIDFRIMFMLNILWNIWCIWSNRMLICLCQNIRDNNNKHSGRISWSVCNAFIFCLLFLTQMHILLALFITSIEFIKNKLNLLIPSANISVLYFWCPTTSFYLFCIFPFSSPLPDVETKWRSGVGVGFRGSVVTVNMPKQSHHHVQVCTWEGCICFKDRDCFYP